MPVKKKLHYRNVRKICQWQTNVNGLIIIWEYNIIFIGNLVNGTSI